MLGDMTAAVGDSIGGNSRLPLSGSSLPFLASANLSALPWPDGSRTQQEPRGLCPLCRGLTHGRRRLHAAPKEGIALRVRGTRARKLHQLINEN